MKYWEIGEKNGFGIECYKLHLKLPYGDEKVIAAFVQDENNNNKYICVWRRCELKGVISHDH